MIVLLATVYCMILIIGRGEVERRRRYITLLMSRIKFMVSRGVTISELVFCRDDYEAKRAYVSAVRRYLNNDNSCLRVMFIGTPSPTTYLLTDEDGMEVVSDTTTAQLLIVEQPGYDGQCSLIKNNVSDFHLTCCDLYHVDFMNLEVCECIDTDFIFCLSELQRTCYTSVLYIRNLTIRDYVCQELKREHMMTTIDDVNIDLVSNETLYRDIWTKLKSSRHASSFVNQQGPYIWMQDYSRNGGDRNVISASIFGKSDLQSVMRVSSMSECNALLHILDTCKKR